MRSHLFQYLRDLVADGLLLMMIVLLVEERSVEGGSRVVDCGHCGSDVRLPADSQVHRMLVKEKLE